MYRVCVDGRFFCMETYEESLAFLRWREREGLESYSIWENDIPIEVGINIKNDIHIVKIKNYLRD